ncbi:transcription termination/antitermination protein NusG [Rhodopseudomonas palustris]|uniref:transcription termination/antitermination protein NusG n=1 Tax=Rhodopseudomonas palustris TaxID=1076 RepID=UPI001304EE49|nr:transcription termination/antitermination NusG family protein [Rhodopseudomonas palustris]
MAMTMAAEMKAGNLGEMREVLRGELQRGQIVDHAGRNGYLAEIVPGARGAWYAVETVPGEDRIAAAWLCARRFGVYLPELKFVEDRRGRKVDVVRLMFPGYVFVFVWDIDAHFTRILACPGVRGVVMTQRAPAVDDRVSFRLRGGLEPVKVPDAAIDQIRTVENFLRPVALAGAADAAQATRKKRPRRKHYAGEQPEEVVVEAPAIFGSRVWSEFSRAMMALDDVGRNRALRELLGLSS